MSVSHFDPSREPIAIVGMACLFPKAPDVATYWENICGKVNAVGEPPASREMGPFLEAREETGLYCVRGGYIGDLAYFHPREFGVMPSAVDGAEPDQFLALEVAHQTLLDAGIPEAPLNRERTEVILGRGTFVNRGTLTQLQHNIALHQFIRLLRELHPEHDEAELREIREKLKAGLPPITAETAAGTSPNLVSGRIANRFDLKGLNCTLDAACASSLIAVERAIHDLREGRCDAAIVGGVQVSTPAPIHNMFAKMGALSHLPHLRPFDRDADGTMLGEGAGMILLKRLRDAQSDGHRIYALVLSVGISSDGRGKAILTPSVEGEELALRRAYEAAEIPPSSVALIEAHGTAMPVGDETEIQALRRVFGERNGAARCGLGSVKSMISHLLPAAGIAGIIKTALALHHKVLPPTIHCENPNPKLEIEKTPFYLNTETRPWIHGASTPRRAGVNAFGFGGINAHAILEECPQPDESLAPSLQRTWDTEVLILHGATRENIIEKGHTVRRFIERFPDTPLRDLAYTMNTSLKESPVRLALVANDTNDLARKLDHALGRLADPSCTRIKDRGGIYFFASPLYGEGKLAFLLPGEGSQYPNMLSDLCIHFPVVRSRFDLMERAFRDHPRGYTPAQFIFPPPPVGAHVDAEEQERLLWQMDGAVESIFVASQALALLLDQLGLKPDVVVGHSAGEYSALIIAGATRANDDEELIRMILEVNTVYQRLAETRKVPRVVLITVGGVDGEIVKALVETSRGALHIAMDNCRHQVVLCAVPEAADQAIARLRSQGAICNTLPFDRPYHTPLFEPAYEFLRESFPPIGSPRSDLTLWSCATASPYPADRDEARKVALEQWIRPVRFRETIEAMYADGVRTFVEVGPRGNLTSFVNDVLRKRPFLAVPSNLRGRSGIAQLHHLVGLLAAHGAPLRLDALYARRAPKRLDLLRHEEPAKREAAAMKINLSLPYLRFGEQEGAPAAWAQHGRREKHPAPGEGHPRHPGTRALDASPAPEVLEAADLTPEMQCYFNTMERFLETQREIMEAFLEEPSREKSVSVREAPAPSTDGSQHMIAGMPLIGEIVSITPGRSLVARRNLDPDQDLFLKDHTLGGRVSTIDTSLIALPVMPFTMTLEMAAEGAARLVSGKLLVELRDVRAHHWITFEDGPVPVEIMARRQSENTVHVIVREGTRESTTTERSARTRTSVSASPIFEATAIFADAYPVPPAQESFAPRDAHASRWTPEQIYKDGMFHGPSFQGVLHVKEWGENGVLARLVTLPKEKLFRSNVDPKLVVDPALLDAAGQLVAFWNAEQDLRGINCTPFRLASLTFYGAPFPAGTELACTARIDKQAPDHLRADLDLFGPDGVLHMHAAGWEDRCFDLPLPICALTAGSKGLALSHPWAAPTTHLLNRDAYRCQRMDRWPQGTFEGHGLIWQKQVASLILTRAEREVWRALRKPARARTEWLFARAAAKDAVGRLLTERHGLAFLPADIEIGSDEWGRPRVAGPLLDGLEHLPAISISHTRGLAVALAADGDLDLDVGIDAERMRPLDEGFEKVAFSEEEQMILTSVAASRRAQWSLRGWCAKESVAKALGTGLAGRPRDLILRKLDESSGIISIEIAGAPGRMRPSFAGATLEVHTYCEEDLVVAVTTCRRSAT